MSLLTPPPPQSNEYGVEYRRVTIFDHNVHDKKTELALRMMFGRLPELRDGIIEHRIHNNYTIIYVTNTLTNVCMECKEKCGWYLPAYLMGNEDTLHIK